MRSNCNCKQKRPGIDIANVVLNLTLWAKKENLKTEKITHKNGNKL